MPYYSDEPIAPKPYELVSFPDKSPTLAKPKGHDRYRKDHLHGCLSLSLSVGTTLHVSTGVVAMGKDVDEASKLPLIKTMMVEQQKLIIPGSSLKGVVRSAYEAITNSTLAVVVGRDSKRVVPRDRHSCRPPKQKTSDSKWLCPASQVFGALDWQGLLQFSDAKCTNQKPAVGFMPSLYRPRPDRPGYLDKKGKAVGRKFYYHAAEAVDRGQQRGIPVQQAGRHYEFTTELHFSNLTPAQLGTVLIVLGQDKQYPMALKVGGGKPIGMGTMAVEIRALQLMGNNFDRYRQYAAPSERYEEGAIATQVTSWIASAHTSLVETEQLEELAEILRYPTDREAPQGMY